MANPTKRLGRGLSSLVSAPDATKLDDRLTLAKEAERPEGQRDRRATFLTHTVPLSSITPNPNQPRRSISDQSIARLAASITRNGLIQPVVVRPVTVDKTASQNAQTTVKYELIAGERRWRAAQAAGLSDLPVLIRDADQEQILELALIENIQREDLNAIDRAKAYKQFQDRFGLKAEQVGQRISEDRTTVTNYLRLLELPQTIQDMVATNLISMGHARSILSTRDTDLQMQLAQKVVVDSLSVRELEDLVRRQRQPHDGRAAKKSTKEKRAHIRDLERQFSRILHTKVRIDEAARKTVERSSSNIIHWMISIASANRSA